MTNKQRATKNTDPIATLVSKDEDQLDAMFLGLSEKFNDDIRKHIQLMREFRDAGFAARADATETEHFLDRAVSSFEGLLGATDAFIAALDNNQPLPVPALRDASKTAREALDKLELDFDAFLAERPSLRARKDRDTAILTGISRTLEPVGG